MVVFCDKFFINTLTSVPVHAEVKKYSVFSGHADERDILTWLSVENRDSVRIFLVHGEMEKLQARKETLLKEGFRNTEISIPGKTILID